MTLDFLLGRIAGRRPDGPAPMVRYTLDRMADGGIHDQLGGGFHRYATDPIWLVPHFEQMLYDNAQLARTYVRAWATLASGDRPAIDAYRGSRSRSSSTCSASSAATTGRSPRARTPTRTGSRARRSPGPPPRSTGCSATDAARSSAAAYGVRDEGNWEGRTILSRLQPAVAEDGTIDAAREARLAEARARLLAVRATRPQPTRDDKAIAAWNGLTIGALADAARLLADRDPDAATRYRDAATTAADAILAGLRRPDGRLGRSWKDGRSSGEGVLEDYADLADGLLALYEATFDERWFVAARELADAILDHFADPAGGFFDTADDHEALVTRPKDPQDNATPSGGSMATLVLLRLAALTGERRYRDGGGPRARRRSRRTSPGIRLAFANWLSAASLATGGIVELAIVGDPADPATRALLAAAREGAPPDLVVAVSATPASSVDPAARRSDDDRRPSDRLRLPRLRLSPAGHRPGRAPGAARREGRDLTPGRAASRRRRSSSSARGRRRRRASPRSSSSSGPPRWRSGRGCTCSRAGRSTRRTRMASAERRRGGRTSAGT